MAERKTTHKKKKSDTPEMAQKPENGAKSTALVPAQEETKSKKEQGSETAKKGRVPSRNLPVADGSRAVGSRSVPIRMTEEERRNLLGRIGVLLLLAAILVAAVLIFMIRPTSYTERTTSVVFLYRADLDVTFVVVDGEIEGEEGGYKGRLTHRADNGKGNVCAAIIGDTLYVVNGGDVEKFGEKVIDCVLSSGGDAVAWRNEGLSLFYAETDAPEEYKCVGEISPYEQYCLSPDGKELLYVYRAADGVDRMSVLSLSGNQPILQADRNLTPVAVSDDSEYLYYLDPQGALCVLNGETGAVEVCANTPSELVFNADMSQLMLRNGEETRLFVNGTLFGVNELGSKDRLELLPNRRAASLSIYMGEHCLIDSLLEQYYIRYVGAAKELIYLVEDDGRGNMKSVAYGIDSVTVTDKYVYFLQTVSGADPHTDLFYLETGEVEYETVCGYVTSYCTNADGSRLTYVTGTGLYGGKPQGQPEWLSDYLVRERGVEVTADDAFYYFKTAGQLWVSDNGESPRHLADGVNWFFVDGDTVYYGIGFADDGIGAVWANYRNSRKSDMLLDGISSIG